MKDLSVIILAAGYSSRMKGEEKQWITFGGIPLLLHSIQTFSGMDIVHEIIVVVQSKDVIKTQELLKQVQGFACYKVVCGGSTRQESAKNAFIHADCRSQFIAIHDGARPLVTAQQIQQVYICAKQYGAASLGAAVQDTIKTVNEEGMICNTVSRDHLFFAQTPQIFRRDWYEEALDRAISHQCEYTDDCQLIEAIGRPISIVSGNYENIKITTKEDLVMAESLWRTRMDFIKQPHHPQKSNIRVGHGYDAHQLVQGRKLILGGVKIPYHLGLLGHSDADVLTHAVMDGLLGAAGMGDIGKMFPNDQIQYQGATSVVLLQQVVDRLKQTGYYIVNIDSTIVAQKPTLSPYLEKMKKQLAYSCDIDINCINIKATTEEGMGFTGTEEGMSAVAIVLIELIK